VKAAVYPPPRLNITTRETEEEFMLKQIRHRLFGIAPDETTIAKRGFTVTDPQVQSRIELIGWAFTQGYHAAIEEVHAEAVAAKLNRLDPELSGFAYEGAGMGLALLDTITPWPTAYLYNFLHGPGKPHAYMIQIGVGWALARLHRPVEGWLKRLDPVVNWLLLDGYGFHETYFGWPKVLGEQAVPKQLIGYARRGFDQGVGRALWFVKGANVDRITATIGALPAPRHNDIWSGVGLASAYAGGVSCGVLENLMDAAGAECFAPLAQGVVFAAKTRLRAGNPTPHTELATQVICGLSLREAASLFDSTGQGLPATGETPAFEEWRQRIQQHFQKQQKEVPA